MHQQTGKQPPQHMFEYIHLAAARCCYGIAAGSGTFNRHSTLNGPSSPRSTGKVDMFFPVLELMQDCLQAQCHLEQQLQCRSSCQTPPYPSAHSTNSILGVQPEPPNINSTPGEQCSHLSPCPAECFLDAQEKDPAQMCCSCQTPVTLSSESS